MTGKLLLEKLSFHSVPMQEYGGQKVRNHLADLRTEGKIILKFILMKHSVRVWTGIICLRIGSSGGFL